MDNQLKKNSQILDISKIVIFLTIFVLILKGLSPIFSPKNNSKAYGIRYDYARGFYGENPQTIDALFIGNSDLYSAMNPLQLWHDYGYTSYVCSEPYQNVFGAYSMLKEVLTCQSPQVIFMEVDSFFSKKESDDIDAAINVALKSSFPLFEYHDRWKSLKSEDFHQDTYSYNTRIRAKGYLYHDNVEPNVEGFSYMEKKRNTNITRISRIYLKKFIELAKENNAEVVFVWYPSATTGSQGRSKTIKELGEEFNVPVIDFNINTYDTEFDWLTDTRDGGNHLNYNGATKMTKYIGKYIDDHYNLADHRKNPSYSQWNKDYEEFMRENKIAY
jgi:Uncharacterized protein conserved in bacteria